MKITNPFEIGYNFQIWVTNSLDWEEAKDHSWYIGIALGKYEERMARANERFKDDKNGFNEEVKKIYKALDEDLKKAEEYVKDRYDQFREDYSKHGLLVNYIRADGVVRDLLYTLEKEEKKNDVF